MKANRDLHICVPVADDAEATRDALSELLTEPLAALGASFKSTGSGILENGNAFPTPDPIETLIEYAKEFDGTPIVILTFAVEDFDAAEDAVRKTTKDTAFNGRFETARWETFEVTESDVAEAYDDMPPWKSIEIYYDEKSIPEGYDHPLDFRNEAMEFIETALEQADAGEWSGAESGMGEVNFGFEVKDFDKAEAIVRKTVSGTPFDCIREITRFDSAADLPEGVH